MPSKPVKTFAVVPAAGMSRRMGTHKLLLPLEGQTVIERVLAAWLASRVEHVVLVVRPDDREVREIGERLGAELVVPADAPAEMKDSVALALSHVAKMHQPTGADAWLLAPADMPRLEARVINRLLAAYRPDDPATLVPISGGRRGHPILLPWSRAGEVHALPTGCGINSLVQAGQIVEVPVDDAGIHDDLDTPEDYRRLG
jgi:molybdenum cofactor cytidylyltransferase